MRQLVEAVHVRGQGPVGEEPVTVHDPPDGVEGDTPVEHAEDPTDADGTALSLGQRATAAPCGSGHPRGGRRLGARARRSRVAACSIPALRPSAAVRHPRKTSSSWGPSQRRQGERARLAASCAVVVDTGHERDRDLGGRADVREAAPRTINVAVAQIAFGVDRTHSQELEQRRPGGRHRLGSVVLDPPDRVGRVAGVEEQLHEAGGGEQPKGGGTERVPGIYGEVPPDDPGHDLVMLEVRDRAHHGPPVRQQTAVSLQRGGRIDHAGERIGVHDAVDRPRGEGRHIAVEVDLVVPVEAGIVCRDGIVSRGERGPPVDHGRGRRRFSSPPSQPPPRPICRTVAAVVGTGPARRSFASSASRACPTVVPHPVEATARTSGLVL